MFYGHSQKQKPEQINMLNKRLALDLWSIQGFFVLILNWNHRYLDREMDISTSGFNFTSSIALLCTGKRFRLNVLLLLDKWSTPMSIPFLCQWLEVIFPDLRFANCRKVWVYIYAKPAAAGGGGAESCLLSIHFGWDSENCSICSVADTAPSPATSTTLQNNQL